MFTPTVRLVKPRRDRFGLAAKPMKKSRGGRSALPRLALVEWI
jgi:hypothetical protein